MTEQETLRVALWHMVDKFKPFTMKPIGAPGSIARAEQDEQIAAYRKAKEALASKDDQGYRNFVSWVDSWVSNPAGSYSTAALDGLFGMTRDKIAALSDMTKDRT